MNDMIKRILLFLAVFVFGSCRIGRSQSNIDAFWESLCAVNKNYTKYQADSSKFKFKCRAEFFQLALEGLRISAGSEMDSLEQRLLSLVNPVLVGDRQPLYKLLVIDAPDHNACVMPDGSVCIFYPLLQTLDTEELLGILAHEIAHYKLKHAEVNYYAKKKKERNNEIWAGVLAGVSSAAYGVGQGLLGQEVNEQLVDNMVRSSLAIAAENAENWGYRYSREQELEADMAAANLLDYLGSGRSHLISAFKKLQTIDRLQGRDDDALPKRKRKKESHPTWGERIYLLENYQTMNDYLDRKVRKQVEKKNR